VRLTWHAEALAKAATFVGEREIHFLIGLVAEREKIGKSFAEQEILHFRRLGGS
jgi:hypothetical protein